MIVFRVFVKTFALYKNFVCLYVIIQILLTISSCFGFFLVQSFCIKYTETIFPACMFATNSSLFYYLIGLRKRLLLLMYACMIGIRAKNPCCINRWKTAERGGACSGCLDSGGFFICLLYYCFENQVLHVSQLYMSKNVAANILDWKTIFD